MPSDRELSDHLRVNSIAVIDALTTGEACRHFLSYPHEKKNLLNSMNYGDDVQ